MANAWVLNHRALEAILKSPEVMAAMRAEADKIVAATAHPDDYEINEFVGRSRDRVSIVTKNPRAHVREARDHNLVRALGAVHGG